MVTFNLSSFAGMNENPNSATRLRFKTESRGGSVLKRSRVAAGVAQPMSDSSDAATPPLPDP
eukprot:COSAG02_NODE_3294_length_6996_cov_21.108743_1_plen_62_part_00